MFCVFVSQPALGSIIWKVKPREDQNEGHILETMDPEALKLYKARDSLRKKKKKAKDAAPDLVRLPCSQLKNRRNVYRIFWEADRRSLEALPRSPRKKRALVKRLAAKMGIEIVDNTPPTNNLRIEDNEVKEFFFLTHRLWRLVL